MSVPVLDEDTRAFLVGNERFRLLPMTAQVVAVPPEADLAVDYGGRTALKTALLWFTDRVLLRFVVLPLLRFNEWLIGRQTHPRAIIARDEVPFIAHLEDQWKDIRAEAEDLISSGDLMPKMGEFIPDLAHFEGFIGQRGGSWRAFALRDPKGWWVDFNTERCPRTCDVLREVPGLQTALFSVFEPHTLLPPHQGANKGQLTVHLGVIVPDPPGSCCLQAGDEVATFEEGKAFAFDDSNTHTAWNEGDGNRISLIVQVERPLPWPASWTNKLAQPLFQTFSVPRRGWRRLERLQGAARG
jgi:beta-hydroxylase